VEEGREGKAREGRRDEENGGDLARGRGVKMGESCFLMAPRKDGRL